MHRNINLTYLISSFSWGRFFLPVVALFYIASEVTLEEFGIIFAVFSLATLLFEIPSGMFADKVGRRYSLLISKACYLVEISILAFGNGFVPFLVAKVISGFGVSLSSGTTESLLYDSLKETGDEDKYKKVVSKWYVWMNVSMAFVFIIGAYLFSIDPKLPAIVSLPFTATSLVLVFFLKEPKVLHRHKDYLSLFREALSKSLRSRRLQYIYLFAFMPSVAASIVLSLSSVYFEKVGVPVFLMGLLAFVSALVTAWAAGSAENLSDRLSERQCLLNDRYIKD